MLMTISEFRIHVEIILQKVFTDWIKKKDGKLAIMGKIQYGKHSVKLRLHERIKIFLWRFARPSLPSFPEEGKFLPTLPFQLRWREAHLFGERLFYPVAWRGSHRNQNCNLQYVQERVTIAKIHDEIK